jgi:hypothetical protein
VKAKLLVAVDIKGRNEKVNEPNGIEPSTTKTREDGPELLDPLDEAMAILLAEGLSPTVVAGTLQTSTKTIQRRLQTDHFRARVDDLRRQRLSAVTARLLAMSNSALDVIKDVMASEDGRLRFKAAETVIRLGRRHQVRAGPTLVEMNAEARTASSVLL